MAMEDEKGEWIKQDAPSSQEPASPRPGVSGMPAGTSGSRPVGIDGVVPFGHFFQAPSPVGGQGRKEHGRQKIVENGVVPFKTVPDLLETNAIG